MSMAGASPVAAIPAPRAVDDPRRELLLGGAVLAAFLAVALGWAGLAPLGSAAIAPGEVKVSGERQAVQTLRGGIVSALAAREGAEVRAGDLLVGFAGAAALDEARALAIRIVDLRAEIARHEADAAGLARVAAPPEFAALAPPDRGEAERALAREQRSLNAALAARAARGASLRAQLGEVGAQVSGTRIRRAAADTQLALNRQELDGVEALAARGYAPRTRVLALQRSAAALEGDSGAYAAEIARLGQTAAEASQQLAEERGKIAQATADRLRDARAELQTLLPQWRLARDALAQTELRAPAAGSVVGLKLHTVGGVAAPGETLMEIVPANRSLVIEARVAPSDVNQIRIGQRANVRVPSIHDRGVPVIAGHVTRLSADSLVDERSGRSFYGAEILVSPRELADFARAAGLAGRLKPGTPVEVQLPLRARTALQFWFEPLAQALVRAGGER